MPSVSNFAVQTPFAFFKRIMRRNAVKSWRGLTPDEIVAVIEKHFEDCRRFYTAGSGDQHFARVRAAIGKAMDPKDPFRARVDLVRAAEPMPQVAKILSATVVRLAPCRHI